MEGSFLEILISVFSKGCLTLHVMLSSIRRRVEGQFDNKNIFRDNGIDLNHRVTESLTQKKWNPTLQICSFRLGSHVHHSHDVKFFTHWC